LARLQEFFDRPQTVAGVEQVSEALVPVFDQWIRVISDHDEQVDLAVFGPQRRV
jgi:hypothetical protein